ncbi:MAG: hypothetical protein A2161_00385 [Candidatus Schekmanbacteria bacterium RBG_13_48_7]|uniref:HEPN domain-containing protein n=1 Tax=Candidatus Schekmanbacteria bacterium RBG_13_48_7 TaxID=1817878 RepID=A0A1F7S937_9BACT|nr:MAG: hypothetical protein A2161_00385 [Candidatus Schekmanbacteria bacterium RBG_13_48_7]
MLFKESAFRGVINRSYYAMFYSLLALLATKKLGSSKHSGVISLFDREFIKEGIFKPDLSRSLRIAFDRRQTHDYGEMNEVTLEIANDSINDAEKFLKNIEEYLRMNGFIKD